MDVGGEARLDFLYSLFSNNDSDYFVRDLWNAKLGIKQIAKIALDDAVFPVIRSMLMREATHFWGETPSALVRRANETALKPETWLATTMITKKGEVMNRETYRNFFGYGT